MNDDSFNGKMETFFNDNCFQKNRIVLKENYAAIALSAHDFNDPNVILASEKAKKSLMRQVNWIIKNKLTSANFTYHICQFPVNERDITRTGGCVVRGTWQAIKDAEVVNND